MFDVSINSSAISSVTRPRTLRITKQGTVETAVLTIRDRDRVYRPSVGDFLHVFRDGGLLEMGGEITRVNAVLDTTAWETTIYVRGWSFEADDVDVDLFTVPTSTTLKTAASSLCLGYLGGKGWTIAIGDDGPILAPGTYRGMTVGAICHEWATQTGIPWRVNGIRQFSFATGSIPAPASFTESNRTVIKKGASWSRDRVRMATRLKATTAGRSTDYFTHVEAHAGDGVKTVFPINALSQEVEATLTADYGAGVSALAVSNLPASITLRAGLTLRAASHGPYTLASDAVVDGGGLTTLALASPLVSAVVAEETLAIDNGALVGLVVNSTTTPLDGSAGWTWDPIQSQLVASVAPSSTTLVRYLTRLRHPVTVRSWVAGIRDSTGAFNAASIRDARVARAGDVDLAQTNARNLTDLAQRLSQPKIFTFETDVADHLWPWMYAPCDFPSHGISGTYRIQDVEIVDIGRLSQRPRMTLTMVEGVEPDWREDWRTVGATGGGGGGVTVGGGGSSGGWTGGGGVYVGLSLPLGGSNIETLDLTSTWQDISEVIPIDHPADVTGTWSFRPCAYQVSPTTPTLPIELRLLIGGTPVSSVSTWAFNSIVATSGYGFPVASYSAPPAGVCLVQARVASLTAIAVVGHARTTRIA